MRYRFIRTNLAIIIILSIIIGGYVFFFLSPRIFKEGTDKMLYTPLKTVLEINNTHSMTIENWEYDENSRKMAVIFSFSSTDTNPSEQYVYRVVNRDRAKKQEEIKYEVLYQSSTFATLLLNNIPKSFNEIAINVGYVDKNAVANGENPKASFTTVYTNVDEVDRAESLGKVNVIELFIGKIEQENASLKDDIAACEKENGELQTQQENILARVAEFRQNERFVTDAEREKIESQIKTYQGVYDSCDEKIKANKQTIEEKTEVMNSNSRKIAELKTITDEQ